MPFCPHCATPFERPTRFCGECGAVLTEAQETPAEDRWLGRVVDRRYRVLSLLGTGGMGLVYKVEHLQLGKVAAMKVLHPEMARDAEAVRRFRTEAQAVSKLDHPHIVQTFDFGQWEDALYLVMEYLKGEDLAALVKREGPLPFDRAAGLFVQVCSALTEAHEGGVIHRDLKPENIFVVARRDGTEHAKVLDFGLAKLRERADGGDITSRNQVIGTPYYMSPEQVRSEPLDARTDIYSLGATLYRVLTGTPPFQATTPIGVLTKHITDALEPPRRRAPELHLPAEADAILSRAMAKSPTDRYGSAEEVRRALETALARHPRSLQPAPLAEAPTRAPVASRTGARATPTFVSDPSSARTRTDPRDEDSDETSAASVKGAERLRRREFDAFERSLRRKRRVALLSLPALLLLVGGAGLWAVMRGKEKASSTEREPNDTPAQATLLPLDAPVQGRVGKRLAGGSPDLDYFRVPIAKGPRVVSARLKGIPGVDLVLELFDGQGAALAKSDAHGDGGGEWLQPVTVGPGEAFVLVRQFWTQGSAPAEDVADPYELEVHWGAPSTGWEVEPNDVPARATPLELGKPMRGYLAGAEDQDWYTFTPATGGRLSGVIAPPDGVEIIVLDPENPGCASPARGRSSKPNQIDCPVIAGRPQTLGLTRRVSPDVDPKTEALSGLDDPYELTLELRPTP